MAFYTFRYFMVAVAYCSVDKQRMGICLRDLHKYFYALVFAGWDIVLNSYSCCFIFLQTKGWVVKPEKFRVWKLNRHDLRLLMPELN